MNRFFFVLSILFLAFGFQSAFANGELPKSVRQIETPKACIREKFSGDSYSEWLRDLPLKSDRKIFSYRGSEIRSSLYNVHSVIDKPLLFHQDLEQCADWGMRFWADFHKDSRKLNRLYLLRYSGARRSFSSSGKDYLGFLKMSFDETNSWSIKKGTNPVAQSDLRPGDMIVQNENGGVGHLSVILDSCRFEDGKKLFLIGYSFMPAQEFHIEANPKRRDGWYDIQGFLEYLEEYFPYGKPELRRF